MKLDSVEIEKTTFKYVDKYYKSIYTYEKTPVRYYTKKTDLLNGIRKGDPIKLIEMADVLFTMKKFDDGVNVLHTVVDNIEPELLDVIAMLCGKVCIRVGLYYDAIIFFYKVTGDLFPEANYEIGKLLIIDGDYNSAYDHISAAVESGFTKANYFLAFLYIKIHNFDDAEEALSKLNGVYVLEEIHYPHMLLAEVYVKTYRMAEAKVLLQTHPEGDLQMRYRLLGMIHKYDMEYKEAIKNFSLITDTGVYNTLIEIGDCYLALDDYSKAEKYYMRAKENMDIRATNALAGLYFKKGYNDKAFGILNRQVK